MTSPAPVLQPSAPSKAQQHIFAALSLLYAAITAAVVPFAQQPGPADPQIVVAYGSGILLADLCTAMLLAALYLESGRGALLALFAAYLYGALMAAAHMVAFPGALPMPAVVDNPQAVGWLFLAWRIGAAVLLLASVLLAGKRETAPKTRLGMRLLAAGALTIAAVAMAFSAIVNLRIEGTIGDRFTELSLTVQWIAVGLYAGALLLVWHKRAFNDVLFLWVGLVLVASVADLTLSNVAGARFTIGWHASRASLVVSACLLLAFLLGDVANRGGRPSRIPVAAAYGGAISVTLAAMFLRWFLDPWLGATIPYTTYYGAVAVAVWFGGFGPAVLATALGYALVNMRYVEPLGRVAIEQPADLISLVLYAFSCSLIIVLGEAMRRARDRYRTAQLALQEKAAQLQRADAKKSEFLAVLSHELRNPLAPLRTGLELLKLAPTGEAATETHDMMDRQIRQLARLIDDLLDVSRIDRGKLDLRRQRILINGVLRAAIDTAKPNIDARGHRLEVRLASDPLYVEGDAVRLAQVVSNLLNNAAKFTPPGGRIELSARSEQGRVRLRVADNGIGIAPDKLEEVFEMFVQLDDSKVTAAGGLGLGLTLARSIVERHGGRLTAHSAGVGKGAEFVVDLPLAPMPQTVAAPKAEAARGAARRRVLVVDDNVDAAHTLAAYLRLAGHRVESALDGEAALRVAEVLHPDVAFIDLNMPRMDGTEVARRLRLTPWGRNARLVALTGMGQQGDIARTREAGFDEHITKPADLQRICDLAAGA